MEIRLEGESGGAVFEDIRHRVTYDRIITVERGASGSSLHERVLRRPSANCNSCQLQRPDGVSQPVGPAACFGARSRLCGKRNESEGAKSPPHQIALAMKKEARCGNKTNSMEI